jgi:5-methylcytosine-specific restriction endonuclease McrA
MINKECSSCHEQKTLDQFAMQRRGKYGRRSQCKLCVRTYNNAVYAEDRDRQLARVNTYRKANPDVIKQTRHKYRQANKDTVYAKNSRRRARRKGSNGSHTASEWKAIKTYYGNICLACGCNQCQLTKDHILPLVMGGTDNADNLQPLCKQCNSRKQAKHIDYRPTNRA